MAERLQQQFQEATAALEQARQELSRRERLAQVGQLAISISHELRQLLSVINNIAYYLHLVWEEKSDPVTLRRHLEKLEDQVALASRIISSLMEYARTERPLRRPTDLNQVIEEQVARLEIPETTRLEKRLAPKLAAALARELVEANQGSIGVRSSPGCGATFQVRLPAA